MSDFRRRATATSMGHVALASRIASMDDPQRAADIIAAFGDVAARYVAGTVTRERYRAVLRELLRDAG